MIHAFVVIFFPAAMTYMYQCPLVTVITLSTYDILYQYDTCVVLYRCRKFAHIIHVRMTRLDRHWVVRKHGRE